MQSNLTSLERMGKAGLSAKLGYHILKNKTRPFLRGAKEATVEAERA